MVRTGPDGRFLNLDGSGPHPLRSILRWGVLDRLRGRRRRSPDQAAVPQVPVDRARLAAPPAPGQPARLTWLGHASWLVQLDGVALLIDPVLSPRLWTVRRNVPAPLGLHELPPIDAVLVTHNHFDHLDLPSVRAARAPVISGLGMHRYVNGSVPQVRELAWGDSTRVGPVEVSFVPSQHWSRRGLHDLNRALWGGFVVRGSRAAVYHSGDTAYFDGFTEIGRRAGRLDAALLPIGAYDPAWFMERQHMNPEQAVQAFVDLGARRMMAMHWGTFKLTDEPLDEPPARLRAEWARRGLPDQPALLPAVGETVEVVAP